MKKGNPEPLSAALKAELETLAARPDSSIDTSDLPEVTDWSQAQRGRFYRPQKHLLSLRLDADIIDWFRQGGDGYQTRINAALREFIERHSA